MKKILCKIGDTITFSIYTGKKEDADLNNTNVIDTNKMTFTDQYIGDNLELVAAFFNVIVIKKEISSITIKQVEIAPLILKLIKDISPITSVTISEDKVVHYDVIDQIITNPQITYLNCYSITAFLFDRLNMIKNIKIELRAPLSRETNFTKMNQLYSYSDAYYKKRILIPTSMVKEDVEELQNFFYVANHLKQIEIEYTKIEVLKYVLKSLKLHGITHVKIYVKQILGHEEEFIHDIDKMKKLIAHDKNITLQLVYHEAYKEKNLLKQFNLNLVKTSFLILGLIIIIIIVLFQFQMTRDREKQNEVKDQIEDIVTDQTDRETSTSENTKKESVYKKRYPEDFTKLLQMNSDTQGWISVPSTNIEYPVVQTKDNSYYLTHSFDKATNKYGWIFMDYRNLIDPLSRNIILYGHDSSNLMFGPLRTMYNKSRYQKKENQIITFNTLKADMKFQIFSIYVTENTSDYLRVLFSNDDEFLTFANQLKEKSVYNFHVDLKKTDHILTLSTCHDNDRLVIHAKLIS